MWGQVRQPGADRLTDALRAPVLPPIRLDRFGRGIDNTRVDVCLSADFLSRATILAQRILTEEFAKYHGGIGFQSPDRRELEGFLKSYVSMSEVAIDRARSASRPELIQLFQFAVWKYLQGVADKQIVRLRTELQSGVSRQVSVSAGNALELYERRVSLARERVGLSYRVVAALLRQLQRVESAELRRLRTSILGMAWPVPEEMLFNPLLQLPELTAEEAVVDFYPLALLAGSSGPAFASCNQLVTRRLAEFLPDWAHSPAGGGGVSSAEASMSHAERIHGATDIERVLLFALRPEEYRDQKYSWLDDPANLDILLRPGVHRGPCEGLTETIDPGCEERWREFQRRLLDDLYSDFRREGLLRSVLASSVAARVHRSLSRKVAVGEVFSFFVGASSYRRLRQRVYSIFPRAEGAPLLKSMRAERFRLRFLSREEQKELLVQFLRDFSRLRRDAKLAYAAARAMGQIRLLQSVNEKTLSRANGSLQEFILPEEAGDRQHKKIRNHVVIKADVRGSTAITAELLERNLNPAAHFSRNFFEPINRLISEFGAEKTFIEGDAVILTLYEYEDVSFKWLSVAHACGLARKILEVVDAQNAQNRQSGLPELELGLGIAFSDGSPAFLYDGDHRILISPAINRADRLSSCSSVLRSSPLHQMTRGRGVQVVARGREDRNDDAGKGADGMLRYNVNGVELDAPAFFKLKLELALERVELQPPGSLETKRYYAGRYPDRRGRIHWLVVHEAPIRIWVANDFSTLERYGRCFYEVVTDRAVVAMVRERLHPGRLAEADLPPDESSLPLNRWLH